MAIEITYWEPKGNTPFVGYVEWTEGRRSFYAHDDNDPVREEIYDERHGDTKYIDVPETCGIPHEVRIALAMLIAPGLVVPANQMEPV